MRWPKYAAYIFLKYFISKTNSSETYVTVNFAGEVSEWLLLNLIPLDNSLLATNITELSRLLLFLFDIVKESSKSIWSTENIIT
jgi:hypothetical protein